MAGYKGHLVGAAAANAAYVGVLHTVHSQWLEKNAGLLSDWQMLVGLFVVALLFGLWPDVDTNSKGQNIFFVIAFVADILLIITGRIEAAAYLGLLAMTPIIGKHRGWTHSKIAMILVPLPIILVPYWNRPDILTACILLYGAAVTGYFSHLLLDGLITKHIHVKG